MQLDISDITCQFGFFLVTQMLACEVWGSRLALPDGKSAPFWGLPVSSILWVTPPSPAGFGASWFLLFSPLTSGVPLHPRRGKGRRAGRSARLFFPALSENKVRKYLHKQEAERFLQIRNMFQPPGLITLFFCVSSCTHGPAQDGVQLTWKVGERFQELRLLWH